MPSPADDAPLIAYEELRGQVVTGSSGGGHIGLVVIVREGISAWLASRIAPNSSTPVGRATESMPRTVPPQPLYANELQAGVARLLAGMVLANPENPGEVRS